MSGEKVQLKVSNGRKQTNGIELLCSVVKERASVKITTHKKMK